MIELKKTKQQFAWIAPIIAFLMLLGIGWFLTWYWQGGLSANSDNMDAETRAALANGQITPGTNGRPGNPNRGLQPAYKFSPSINIFGKGSIQPVMVNGEMDWATFVGPFQVRAKLRNPVKAEYDFTLYARREAAFSGADLQYVQLLTQLALNPITQQQAHVPPKTVQDLVSASSGGTKFIWPQLTLPAADVSAVAAAWQQYVRAADATQHSNLATKMFDVVTAAGQHGLAASHDSLAAEVTRFRQIVSTDQEAQFREAIKQAQAIHLIPAKRAADAAVTAPRPVAASTLPSSRSPDALPPVMASPARTSSGFPSTQPGSSALSATTLPTTLPAP